MNFGLLSESDNGNFADPRIMGDSSRIYPVGYQSMTYADLMFIVV